MCGGQDDAISGGDEMSHTWFRVNVPQPGLYGLPGERLTLFYLESRVGEMEEWSNLWLFKKKQCYLVSAGACSRPMNECWDLHQFSSAYVQVGSNFTMCLM